MEVATADYRIPTHDGSASSMQQISPDAAMIAYATPLFADDALRQRILASNNHEFHTKVRSWTSSRDCCFSLLPN